MKLKRFLSIILAALTAVSMLSVLSGCGGQKEYKVTVKDALGNPYTSGLIVEFMQNGKRVAMQPCDENGVATKKLEKGKYEIALSATGNDVEYYYEENQTVTAKNNKIDIIMSYKLSGKPETLYVDSDEFDAYAVNVGCTYVNIETDKRNYFLFTPKKEGTYEISVVDGKNTEIGYYGAPHYVQEKNVGEIKDNKIEISVTDDMIGSGGSGTSVYVFGIDAKDKKTKNCIFSIERVGEHKKTIEDEPWIIYKKTADLKAYTLPAGAQIKEFDLKASTDTYKFVYNDDDGFYHLNSKTGPLVLVRLAEDCEYIACFKTMLDRSGVVKYFFDKNEKFQKKESYSECLLEYIEYVDEAEGVYPLTEDLKYIIQQRGDYAGWWNSESSTYIFRDANGDIIPGINPEIAWLLMCCYIE